MAAVLESALSSSGLDRIANGVLSDSDIISYFAGQTSPAPLLIALLLALIGICILFRIFHGRDNMVHQIISCILGVAFLYCFTVLVLQIDPFGISHYLSPLPFALFRSDILVILPFTGTDISYICSEIVSLIIICFLFRFVDRLLNHGKSFWIWLIIRLLTVAAVVFLNLAVNYFLNLFFPSEYIQYASIILLGILAVSILVGLFNPILCIIFTVVNPVFGLLYSFFFSSFIGKQLICSVLSSFFLCLFQYIMEFLGYSVWDISNAALPYWAGSAVILLLCSYLIDTRIKK